MGNEFAVTLASRRVNVARALFNRIYDERDATLAKLRETRHLTLHEWHRVVRAAWWDQAKHDAYDYRAARRELRNATKALADTVAQSGVVRELAA